MGTKHKHYDVIVAWANGEEIEYRLGPNDSWISIVNPNWFYSTEYRIKPKKVKKEGWVNVYKGSLLAVHTVKHFADDAIACIRIEWEEEE